MKVKLGIVEDNQSMLNMLSDYFGKHQNFELIMTASSGIDAIAKIEKYSPDVVLLDIVLPDIDGFGIMSQLKSDTKPKFLILSGLSQESFVTKALKSGASYYMIKPFDLETLSERLCDIVGFTATNPSSLAHNTYQKVSTDYKRGLSGTRNKSADEKISNIFIAVGIPAHVKGYHFLREAIKLTIENPEIINSITKKLYPSIAEIFSTSASKVERAIRHAIEISWNRGKIENINTIFGIKIYSSHEKPTNGEFIALVADKLLIEGA